MGGLICIFDTRGSINGDDHLESISAETLFRRIFLVPGVVFYRVNVWAKHSCTPGTKALEQSLFNNNSLCFIACALYFVFFQTQIKCHRFVAETRCSQYVLFSIVSPCQISVTTNAGD